MQKSIAIWGSVVLIVLALGMSGCASNNDSMNKPSGSSGTTGNPAAAPSPNTPAEQPAKEGNSEQDKPQFVASNEAFRIYQPAPDSTVGQSIVVKGQARVFEAVLNYSIEDGHNILAEGFASASMGATGMGRFYIHRQDRYTDKSDYYVKYLRVECKGRQTYTCTPYSP